MTEKIIRYTDDGYSAMVQGTIVGDLVRCKDCKWYEKLSENPSYGYCHAMKHCHYSKHWEISIYRTYNEDFFCADAERREEDD